MSFSSFNKENDLKVKENLEETINGVNEISLKQDILSQLNLTKEPVEKKISFTYSTYPSQNEKMEKLAKEKGFKNKSEFLSAIIDAL